MVSVRNQRIMQDLLDFNEHQEAIGISLLMVEDDMSRLIVTVKGLSGSPFEGGSFNIEIRPPLDFPFKPPKIFMITPVWHPNIDLEDGGRVCMDLISERWGTGISLVECAEAVRSLLNDPNPDSPLNAAAAIMLDMKPALYQDNAILWTQVFADGKPSSPLEEKWSVLVGLGMDAREAAIKGASFNWNLDEVVNRCGL